MSNSRKIKSVRNSNAKRGNQNALKHGAFSRAFVLPGESLEDFRTLQAELEAELQPANLLEKESVLTILLWMWRRRQFNRLAAIRTAIATPDAQAPGAAEDPVTFVLEKAGLIRSRRLAIKTHTMTIRWALAATKAAENHIDLNRIAAGLRHHFGIAAEALAEESTPDDLTHRKDVFTAFIVENLEAKLEQFVANELKNSNSFAREVAEQICPVNPLAEIEVAARIDAEIDKAMRRFMQIRASQQALRALEATEPRVINTAENSPGSRRLLATRKD